MRERKLIIIKLQEFSMNLAEKKYLKDSCVCIGKLVRKKIHLLKVLCIIGKLFSAL